MTQKCDLIRFSNVRALSHHLWCCFSLSVFPQRLQQRSFLPIHPELPNKIFSSAIYELLCSYVTGCYGAERGLCFTAHRLMTLAVGYFPRLSGRSLFCFCLVHILITSSVNHLLLICAASAGFSCQIFHFFLWEISTHTCLWMELKRKPPWFKLAIIF